MIQDQYSRSDLIVFIFEWKAKPSEKHEIPEWNRFFGNNDICLEINTENWRISKFLGASSKNS